MRTRVTARLRLQGGGSARRRGSVLQDRAPLLRINFEVQHGLDLDIAFLGGAIA